MRSLSFWMAAWLAIPASAAEREFNASNYPIDQTPPGFRSTVGGAGKPGDWKVILDDDSSPAGLPVSGASSINKRAVLAQLAKDPIANHFPLLIFSQETYGDFKLTTRLKIVGGTAEQIAGIAFRFQSETNYFVAAANVLRSNICCYRVDRGQIQVLRGSGVKMPVSGNEWHEMTLQCEGNRMDFWFDTNDPVKLLLDAPAAGYIGFWTKSDAVAYFADTRITYTPREIMAQSLARDALHEYSRLIDLKIFADREGGPAPTVVGCKDARDLGQPGGSVEADVISRGTAYYAKDKKTVTVTLPLRDRNGDSIAAVRVVMKSFPGQTEDNAVVRARPVVKYIQDRVHSVEELLR